MKWDANRPITDAGSLVAAPILPAGPDTTEALNTEALPARVPSAPLATATLQQLRAVEAWTRNNRNPTRRERWSLTIGTQLVRELETVPDLDVLDWPDVIHCIDPDNTPSQRLAERVGSRNLGPTRMPPPFDHLAVDAWGQTREEWRARRR